MTYLLLKWIHILSSTILFGTGIGSAFYLFMANRRKDLAAMYFATRHVVIADWMFTTPSVVIQLITGIGLVHLGGYELTERWIMWALMLYFFAGACWLPVVWMQIKMRDMAKHALETNTELPDRYWAYDRWWIILGSVAFPAIIIVFWLMVYKPSF
ncbi:MAG: DUF2269 domain-containing protein [Rickettsiales bacterium]|nr:DUF2269 domain-containing protein [Rickettsiales bacterium]